MRGELWKNIMKQKTMEPLLFYARNVGKNIRASKRPSNFKYLLYFNGQLIGKYDLEHSTFLKHFVINLNYRNPKMSFTLIKFHCAQYGKELNLENYKVYDEGYYVCNECFHTKMNSQNGFEP